MYGAADDSSLDEISQKVVKDDDAVWRARTRVFGTFVCFFGLFVVTSRVPEAAKVGNQAHQSRSEMIKKSIFSSNVSVTNMSDPKQLYVEVTSDYKSKLEFQGYHSFANGYIVEPCRTTTFSVLPTTFETAVVGNISVQWHIDCSEAELQELQGTVVYTKFDQTGNCPVTVTLRSESGDTLETAVGTFYSRYVRRELRALNTKDRDSFFDAFKTMLTINTEEGKALYGPNYHSILHYLEMHLLKASKRKCDNFHDGLGFPTQHLAMTNEFEMAVQAVNPVLAVPYWDVTIDQAMVDSNNISSIYKSNVFSDDWFGSVSKNSDHVTKGQWAYVEFPSNRSFAVTNAWGLLRSPWNLNPSQYVTRYNSVCGVVAGWEPSFRWPTCSVHYNMTFDDAWSNWNYYSWSSSYRPHGPVHIHVGGAGGDCVNWDESLKHILKPEEISQLKVTAFLLSRNGYRKYIKDKDRGTAGFLLEPPTYCSEDAASQCKMHCYGNGNFSDSVLNQFIGQIMDMQDRGESLISRTTLDFERLSRAERVELVQTVYCDSNFWAGDQLESSSPIESLFWVIHPTMDRLIQYKQITNPFKSLEFENPTGNKTVYCRYHETSNCEGHHPGDLTFFQSLSYNTSSSKFVSQYLTNRELLDAINPLGDYAMQYIYDNFEWEHCSEVYGIDFPHPSSSVKRP